MRNHLSIIVFLSFIHFNLNAKEELFEFIPNVIQENWDDAGLLDDSFFSDINNIKLLAYQGNYRSDKQTNIKHPSSKNKYKESPVQIQEDIVDRYISLVMEYVGLLKQVQSGDNEASERVAEIAQEIATLSQNAEFQQELGKEKNKRKLEEVSKVVMDAINDTDEDQPSITEEDKEDGSSYAAPSGFGILENNVFSPYASIDRQYQRTSEVPMPFIKQVPQLNKGTPDA